MRAAVAILVSFVGVAVSAQAPDTPPAGHAADFSGIYEAAVFVGVPSVRQPDPYPFTAPAKRAFDAYDPLAVDPRQANDCAQDTMPGILWSGNPMQIVQDRGMITMRFERGNTVRSIPMNGAPPAAGQPPAALGHSVGRWDADVLTIETTHMSGGSIFNNRGYPLSPEARITERYWREPGQSDLQLEVLVDDPANYTATFELGREWIWAPHERIRPWVCVDLGPKDAEPDLDELTRILEQL